MRIIVFDTETTGFPSPSLPLTEQPHIVQFAAVTIDCDLAARKLKEIERIDTLLNPGAPIPPDATRVHGIRDSDVITAPNFGEMVERITGCFTNAHVVVGHNLDFDRTMLELELSRLGLPKNIFPSQTFDTMLAGTNVAKIPDGRGGYRYPTLTALYKHFFGETFTGAHRALDDVIATARIMREFLKLGIFLPKEPDQGSLF